MRNCSQHFRIYKTVVFIEFVGVQANNQNGLTFNRDAFKKIDIRNADSMIDALKEIRPDIVLHLAGQVAVTSSVTDPREDFEINALGTLNVLEAIRKESPDSFLIRMT